jgi:hypothetical protein
MFRGGGRPAPMLEWLRTIKMDRLAVQIAGSVMLQRYMRQTGNYLNVLSISADDRCCRKRLESVAEQ